MLKNGLSGRDFGGTAGHSDGWVNQTSRSGKGNWKCAGRTPMIVYGASPRVSVLPTIRESPSNRRCHSSAPIIATAGPPGESSSGRKPRPNSGSTPRMLRKPADTRAAFRTSGWAPPVIVTFSWPLKAPIPVKDRALAFISMNRTGVAPPETFTNRSGSRYSSGFSNTS